MKLSTLFSAVLATLLPLFTGTAAEAAPILFNNFSTTADGTKPAGWTFSAGLTAGVNPGTLPPEASEGAKILRVTNPNSGSYANFSRPFDRFTNATDEGQLSVSFKLKINTFTESSWLVYLNDTADSAVPGLLGIQINQGKLSVYSGTGSVGVTPKWNAINQIILNNTDWYRFDLEVNLNTQTYVFKITNLSNAAQSYETAPLYLAADRASLNNILFRSLGAGANLSNMAVDWSITDVAVHSIPEGSAVALLGSGALLLAGVTVRRRNH